jgi:Tfp pilus assembly PilM family ATPase
LARYLVLDWDYQQLHVVSAAINKGKVRLEQAVAWEVPSSPNPAQAEELGKLLRERLTEAGIAPAPLLVAIGRDRVILKDIRHPPVPPADEPSLVRLQAVRELNDPADEVIIDYVSRAAAQGNERRALAVILRRELLQTYQTLCKAAGLKLAGICPRSFGAVWSAKTAGAKETVAVLTVSDRWAEFCILRGETLLLARALPVSAGHPDVLLGEIRRNLAVFAGQSGQEPVRELYIADGTTAGGLRERLQDKLAIPVHSLDPLGELSTPAQRRGTFAGAVGLLHAVAGQGKLPINFIQPRDARPAGNPEQRKAILAAGLVAAAILAALALGYTELAARARTVEILTQQKTQLEQQLALMKDDEKRIKAIGDWVSSEVVWLDELYDLTSRFPDTNALRVTRITGDPLQRSGSDKHVARLTLKGITTDNFDAVDKLISQMVGDGYYRVDPKVIERNTGPDRLRFSQQFSTRLDIEPRPPVRYVRLLPPPKHSPARDSAPADADLFDFGALFNGVRP